jgi:hypothetical protein
MSYGSAERKAWLELRIDTLGNVLNREIRELGHRFCRASFGITEYPGELDIFVGFNILTNVMLRIDKHVLGERIRRSTKERSGR